MELSSSKNTKCIQYIACEYCARPLDARFRLTLLVILRALGLIFDVRAPRFRPETSGSPDARFKLTRKHKLLGAHRCGLPRRWLFDLV